jgi:hypothetical protein
MLKKVILAVIAMCLILCTACSSTSESSNKISLNDAPDILDLSLLLPSRFEQVDAASEGMSNEDLGLGSDFSEVQVYISEDPIQMIYGFMAVFESRVEGAIWDKQLEDDAGMKDMIEQSIMEGAAEGGVEATLPIMEVTHPDIGDSAILGEGYLESYGYYFGFDILCYRSSKTYIFLYSVSMSSDKESLVKIAEEIERRIGEFDH